MLGDARGLSSTPWMTVPDTARAAPASRQPQVRGSRASRTIWDAAESRVPPKKAPRISSGVRGTAPKHRLASASRTTSSPNPQRKRLLFGCFRIEDIRQFFISLSPSRIGL